MRTEGISYKYLTTKNYLQPNKTKQFWTTTNKIKQGPPQKIFMPAFQFIIEIFKKKRERMKKKKKERKEKKRKEKTSTLF